MRAGPLAVDAAVGGMDDRRPAAGAGDCDVGKAAFLLEAGEAAFVERRAARGTRLLPSRRRKTVSNSSPLAAWMVMMVTFSPARASSLSITRLTCSRKAPRDSYSSIARVSSARFSSRPAALGRAVGLKHRGIAGLFEDDPRELGVWKSGAPSRASGRYRRAKLAERPAGLRRELVTVEQRARRRSAAAPAAWRARWWMVASALSPRPRLGVFTIRSNARSSAGERIRRR